MSDGRPDVAYHRTPGAVIPALEVTSAVASPGSRSSAPASGGDVRPATSFLLLALLAIIVVAAAVQLARSAAM